MWFRRFYRRRREPPPLLLPSLDRVGELIERVVALLDDVTLASEPPPPREEIVLQEHNPGPAADGWVALVSSPDGYRLLQRDGPPPDRGAVLEVEDGSLVVLRLGPSPFPGDRRRCAFVERKEPLSTERTFDP